MRNIRLDLEYDGRNYCGWQCQPNGVTVEATLKNAVEGIVHHPVTLNSSGRTDSGVHAEQHVAQFRSETTLPVFNLLRGINSLLPKDITIYRLLDMPQEWNARFDAFEREYRYTFYNHPSPSALLRHRTYWVRYPLDLDAMRVAAKYFEGRHDFTSFRSINCDAKNPVRTLLEASLRDVKPLIHLRVRGQAFLRHQVRTIAGTLFHVGMGKMTADSIPDVLAAKDRCQAGPSLPAHALTLVAVHYPCDEDILKDIGHRSLFPI